MKAQSPRRSPTLGKADPRRVAPSEPGKALGRRWEGLVGPALEGRVDAFIARDPGAPSRSQLKARDAVIAVNGKIVKPSHRVVPGDRVTVEWTAEEPSTLEAEDLPLSILFEDERVVVIDKAQGMVTHPGAGNRRGTLANALLGHLRRKEAVLPSQMEALTRQPALRAGIVHRLDKETSGVIVAAKDLEAQVFLSEQFKERSARKEYLAIVRGLPSPASGRISDRLGRDRRDRKRFTSVVEGGRTAITDYRVLAYWRAPIREGRGNEVAEAYALMSLRPKTGRTHQLRVHMAGLRTPIVGDPIYGKRDARFPEARLMLHAFRLKITLPGDSEPRLFRAPLPPRFGELLRDLETAFGPRRRP